MSMFYVGLDPRFDMEQLGYLPDFLDEGDLRPAAEQYDQKYVGGWNPIGGWKFDAKTLVLKYPGDPPLKPFAFTMLHKEYILFYPYAQVLILGGDGKFQVARLD